ncbi:MAG TPA: MCE family protein [Bacteroidetes bacterium]|nr:MCE family protein [Bacteroidota bacterium]
MENRSQEVKAGILVFVAIVIFLVFVFAITKASFKTEYKSYTARFSYTNGIKKGSQVRYGGVLVGQVDQVYFPTDNDSEIEILLQVEKETPVKKNSYAYITSIGIMGEFYIEITTGTPDAELLPPDSRLTSKDVAGFAQMSEPLEKVSHELEELLVNINSLMTQKNLGHISNMVSNLDTLLDSGAARALSLMERMDGLTAELQAITHNINEMMESNSDSLGKMIGHFNSSMARAETLLTDLSRVTTQVGGAVSANEANLHQAILNFNEASRNFEVLSRRLKQEPWSLVRKKRLPEK